MEIRGTKPQQIQPAETNSTSETKASDIEKQKGFETQDHIETDQSDGVEVFQGAGSGLIADEKIDGSGKNPLSVFDRDQQLINVVAVNVDTITDGGGKENLLPTKDPFSSVQTITRDSG